MELKKMIKCDLECKIRRRDINLTQLMIPYSALPTITKWLLRFLKESVIQKSLRHAPNNTTPESGTALKNQYARREWVAIQSVMKFSFVL